ncbi:hypothetical protein BYT27DRAFT_7205888 [Phlegmacium glaucopus]|nr:hypothetical protein BYT27DRAFT_7180793 [Phlegmacium glaucopus]KAF8814871.1 hypothetical protein BYT27DRAFT_7205888 [Phlegmacium glaucopus]
MRETRYETSLVASSITAELISNPLQNSSQQGPPPTATVPARTVLHTAEAALRPLLNGVQTQEQLDALIRNLIRDTTRENEAREGIRDPPVHNPKGRPRTQRLTGPTEGRPRGGGARAGPVQKSLRRCSECHQSGHNRTTCPKQMS